MSTALTILLVMIASGPVDDGSTVDDPFTPAIARATREALGSETRVVMRMVATLPSDAEVVALGRGVHADAVVEVTWSLPDHLRTTIRVERSGSGRWVDRAIAFREIDAPSERSRTVGFAIASMLPERRVLAAAPPPPKRAVVTKAPPEATSEPEPLLHAAPPPEPPPSRDCIMRAPCPARRSRPSESATTRVALAARSTSGTGSVARCPSGSAWARGWGRIHPPGW